MPPDRRNSAVLNRSHMVTLYKGHRGTTAPPPEDGGAQQQARVSCSLRSLRSLRGRRSPCARRMRGERTARSALAPVARSGGRGGSCPPTLRRCVVRGQDMQDNALFDNDGLFQITPLTAGTHCFVGLRHQLRRSGPSTSEACFEASNCLRADRTCRTPTHLAMSGTPSAGGRRTGGEEAHRAQTMSATCGDHASSRDQERSSYILIFLTQAQAEGRCRRCYVTAHPCQMRCASTI